MLQLERFRFAKSLLYEKHLLQRCIAAAVYGIAAYDHSLIQNVVNHVL